MKNFLSIHIIKCQHYSDLRPLYFKGYHISLDYTIFPKNVLKQCNKMYHKGIPFAEHNFSPFQDMFFVIVLFESQSKTLYRVLFSSLYLQICIFYFGISKYLNFTRELRRRFDRKYTLDLPKHCVVKSYRSGNVGNRF